EVVAWYDLRWQVELFFKELKSVLGLADYRVRKYVQAGGWGELCCVAFCYLGGVRARELAPAGLAAGERARGERAGCQGLVQRLRQVLHRRALQRLHRWASTRSGLAKLRRFLRRACEAPDPLLIAA